MLPRASRLNRSVDFTATVRRGVRAGRPTLVVHARRTPQLSGVRVGLVVGKSVGNAVTRNAVKRRLRHLAAERIAVSPGGLDVVVRALPRAAMYPDELRLDLPSAWARAVSRLTREGAL